MSIYDGTPLVDIQGIIDNGANQLTINIPYTSGVGTYDAYSSVYIPNNTGTGEGEISIVFVLHILQGHLVHRELYRDYRG